MYLVELTSNAKQIINLSQFDVNNLPWGSSRESNMGKNVLQIDTVVGALTENTLLDLAPICKSLFIVNVVP